MLFEYFAQDKANHANNECSQECGKKVIYRKSKTEPLRKPCSKIEYARIDGQSKQA
jgi:hypothetical protein